ncbi:MAG: DEAD/DEAH box helicase [Simkaniaceae bacterium]|nr:DEAD/DEAH box helicase [Candidatus Sacchlamyda saccharinae]
MHVFSKKDLSDGKKLLDEKRVLGLLFSEGTYQIEVIAELNPKEVVWPFMQISDVGEVMDAFCTCPAAEQKGSCLHLAASFLKIMKEEPLHVRFKESLWNQIGWLCFDRLGDQPKNLKVSKGAYEGFSKAGKREILIKAKPKAKKKLEEILYNRPVETEETSLKFSNLSQEELILWREGRPSDHLRYELSFWADLAKWWMMLQEEGAKYTLTFSDEDLPLFLTAEFPDFEFEFSIDLTDWPQIIPSLQFVESSLKVYPHKNGKLERIVFLKDQGVLSLEYHEGGPNHSEKKQGIQLGEWCLVPGIGFFPGETDPLLEQSQIEKSQISQFFEKHLKLLQKKLVGEKIHTHPASLRYDLYFDKKSTLHIEGYLFEKGDLSEKDAHFFGQWAYLPSKGFFPVEDSLFEGGKLSIEKGKISDFIDRHRVWLNGIEGFQTHVSGMESHLGFQLDEEGKLTFFTRLEFTEESEHVQDLGDWIYVAEKGFYAKMTSRPGAFIKAGMQVSSFEISKFINQHRDELEPIPGFFAGRCPLEKSGLNIGFNDEGRIYIHPEFFFHEGYIPEKVRIYGDYTYVEGEGFYLIPHHGRLPESYKVEKVIDRMAEAYFVGYELELLYPHVITIDPKLKRPERMDLHLLHLKRQPAAKTGQWVLELEYETDLGRARPFEIWEAFGQGRQYLFSEAGLLFLRQKTFDWIKDKNKKRWLEKGDFVRLTTLEFLRLCGMQEMIEPEGETKKAKMARKLLRDFLAFKPPTEIDITGLSSDLRPYQKTGVDWLWFLHSYGLSGLLCDEMGLGKTHQAMALIAGVKNQSTPKKSRFLVVCPTSVIYHWEKLINQFLPNIKPYVFHGIGRKFETFSHDSYDLLLTSYGIVRTENLALSSCDFDLVIFDELQVAKNEKSLTHKALKNLKATMRVGLTGTPIENRLLELKALFDLVVPTYLPSVAVFKEMFIHPIEKYQDAQRRELLSRLIRPFLLRRKKSEVLTELPEKIEEVALCDLTKEQHHIYHDIIAQNRDALLKELKDDTKPPPIAHIFSMLSKLKQVCNHPCLVTKDIQKYKDHQSGKWDLFVELLNETRDSGQKLVVFSQYLGMLDIIGMHLKEHGIAFAEIRGSTRNRKDEVQRFADDPTCEVFLGSLQAAGVGIDLIAASVVIHYDRWWNPAKENQATDRVHRMGQKRGVQVFKLVTKGTIEEQIDRLIEKKLSLAKGVIGFDDQDQIKGFDRQELIDLLQMLE